MNQADPKEQPSVQTQQQFVAIPPNAFFPQQKDDEIDLAELWKAIWQGKFTIVAITALFAVASIFYAKSLPNIYKASAILAPAHKEGGAGGLAGLAGQFGGLASMAGINLGGGQSDKTSLALEVIKSRSFLESFIQKNDLLVPLIAADDWDHTTDTLIINQTFYNSEKNEWVRQVSYPKKTIPSLWEGYEAFKEILAISQDKETGMVTLELEYFEPTKAQKWLTLLVKDINEYLRAKDQKEAQQSIDYLTAKLEETNIATMEAVFYKLIEEQTKNMMLTMVKPEYVLETIQPPQVPEQKAKPKRALIVVLGTMLGGILSMLIVLIRYFTMASKTEKNEF